MTIIAKALEFSEAMYDNQSKERLTNAVKVSLPDFTTEIANWKVIDYLKGLQKLRNLKKTDGKKVKDIDIDRGRDANLSGTKESQNCTLVLAEGNSGLGCVDAYVACFPDGKDYYGTLALRGKGLNVHNITEKNKHKEEENVEIQRFKRMMGLKHNTTSLKDCRYGKILIFADTDPDGYHIIGILIDYIVSRYPFLLEEGVVWYPLMPYVGVTFKQKKKEVRLQFYSLSEYKQWKDDNPIRCEVIYYKGMGSFNPEDVVEYQKKPKFMRLILDNRGRRRVDLLFDNHYSDERKEWIFKPSKPIPIEDLPSCSIKDKELGISGRLYDQKVSDFIDVNMKEYAHVALQRSIPGIDGLKPPQRDIVWGIINKWKNSGELMKLTQFCGYVSDLTHYAQGDQSIPETAKRMFFDYVGKNNLPFMEVNGIIGSREGGGVDCSSARYLKVRKSWWVDYVYRKEDKPLYRMVQEEGKDIKPLYLCPIVCILLINGGKGTATGWSTTIPRHNPLEIIDLHLELLDNPKTQFSLLPWYRGFTGKIRPLEKEVEVVIDDGEETQTITVTKSVETCGVMAVKGDKVVISELPIDTWTAPYVTYLKKLVKEKTLIKSVRDRSRNGDIKIEVVPLPDVTLSRKDLKLKSYIAVSNLISLDVDFVPIHHSTTTDILLSYHKQRLQWYKDRKSLRVAFLLNAVKTAELELLFVKEVRNKTIILSQPKRLVLDSMESKGYPASFLKMGMDAQVDEAVEIAEKKVKDLKRSYKKYNAIRPEDIWKGELLEFREAYLKRY